MGLSLKKIIKAVPKVVSKAGLSVADAFSYGSASKVTGQSSYLNDYSKSLTGNDYLTNSVLSAQAGLNYLSGGSMSTLGNVVQGAVGLLGGSNSSFGGILQSVLGHLGDYGQSILNVQNQKDLAAYTAARQNELNEAAFNRNLYQWNLENQYNTPAAQMQRYAEAGLNPNLIYGQQNLSAGSPELKPATYDPGEYQPVDHSAQRQALKLAMLEHAQRIENQAIQNDLARQELALRIKSSEREDEKLNLLKSRAVNLTNPTDWDDYWDGVEKSEYQRLRNEKLRQEVEGNTGLPGFLDTMWKAGKSAANLVKKGNYIERASQKFRKY